MDTVYRFVTKAGTFSAHYALSLQEARAVVERTFNLDLSGAKVEVLYKGAVVERFTLA